MKKRNGMTVAAIALMLVAMMLFAACAKTEPAIAPADETTGQTETAPAPEPETDEISFDGAPAATVEAELPPETELPAEETEQPEEEKPAGEPAQLADGTYSVQLHRDQTVDSSGRVWATIGFLRYVELPDETVSALKEGDTVKLPMYSFVIEDMSREKNGDADTILFNEGTERCTFISETKTWRFMWPSETPYTYEAEQYTLRLAEDVILTDEYTPYIEGQNIYGVEYEEGDETIGALDCLEDYFNHYINQETELMTVVIRGGEIAEAVIEYRDE